MINVYKEAGWTSRDAVNKVRGLLREKHIGHGGTLDPAAEGVLPVCLGRATRLFDYLTAQGKTYEARLLLGKTSTTDDLEGEILTETDAIVSEEALDALLPAFVGEIEQVPPMYSALHVDGKRLYELAREGKTVERAPRRVTVYALERLSPLENNECTLRITCGSGTYIRSLCRDIGEKLGTGGLMASLLRTRAGGLTIENALTVGQLEERLAAGDRSFIRPTDEAISFLPAVTAEDAALGKLFNGVPVPASATDSPEAEDLVRMYCAGRFFGIAEKTNGTFTLRCRLGGYE